MWNEGEDDDDDAWWGNDFEARGKAVSRVPKKHAHDAKDAGAVLGNQPQVGHQH